MPTNYGLHWVEVEVQWPDGRRVFAATNFFVSNTLATVSVVATATNAAEIGNIPAVFKFIRTGSTNDTLTVTYQFTGTATKFVDYRRAQGDAPDFITIPAGTNSATLTILPVNDVLSEGTETAILTLTAQPNYNLGSSKSAAISIADNQSSGLVEETFLRVLEEATVLVPPVPRAPASLSPIDAEGRGDGAVLTKAPSTSGLDRTLPAGADGALIRLTIRVIAPDAVTLTWATEPGHTYRVEYKDDLGDPAWKELSDSVTAATATTSWTDTTASPARQRFYMVRVLN
jgi:hypothetical protein